jgi:hypothetical protein
VGGPPPVPGDRPFLRGLSEPAADLAIRELAKIIAELRAAGLAYQLTKAGHLRRAVVAAAEALA